MSTSWMLVFAVLFFVAALMKRPRRRRRGGRNSKGFEVVSNEKPQQATSQGQDLYKEWKDNSQKTEGNRAKYRDKFQLLNGAEIALYNKLTEAVPALLVFSQVSMSQVIDSAELFKVTLVHALQKATRAL